MAHEILSVKLYELDEKIGRMHSRIQLTETGRHEKVRTETDALRQECEETELTLRKKLQYSKAGTVSELSKAYRDIEQIIHKTKAERQMREPDGRSDAVMTEEKILLAEYALDFAILAADRALLSAMEAIDAQMTQQEKED